MDAEDTKYPSRIKPDSTRTLLIALALLLLNALVYLGIFLSVNYAGPVVIFGDSLVTGVRRPSFDNLHKLQRYVQGNLQNRGVIEYGEAGLKVKELLDYWNTVGVQINKNLVTGYILMWDSDVANVDEASLAPSEVLSVRAAFRSDFLTLGRSILQSGAHLAVASVQFMGQNDTDVHGVNKTSAILEYDVIYRDVCRELGVPYLDVRTPLLKVLASGTNPTYDYIHTNAIGTAIVGDIFVKQFRQWNSRY